MHGLKGLRRHALIFGTITSLIATGLWVQLEGAAATSTNPDTIQYAQNNGANGTYIKYVPGDGSAPTSQAVTGGGGCSTPTVHGAPVLRFSAKYYANGYSGSSVGATVGAFDSIEVHVLNPSTGSVSVVGPTSTFTLAGQVCPGESITTSSNDVTGTLTFVAGSSCKSYTGFSASSENKSVTFLSQQLAGA